MPTTPDIQHLTAVARDRIVDYSANEKPNEFALFTKIVKFQSLYVIKKYLCNTPMVVSNLKAINIDRK
jgi:hypothetical protein